MGSYWNNLLTSAHLTVLSGIVQVQVRDVKQSSNFRTSILKFEFKLDTFGIRILD